MLTNRIILKMWVLNKFFFLFFKRNQSLMPQKFPLQTLSWLNLLHTKKVTVWQLVKLMEQHWLRLEKIILVLLVWMETWKTQHFLKNWENFIQRGNFLNNVPFYKTLCLFSCKLPVESIFIASLSNQNDPFLNIWTLTM